MIKTVPIGIFVVVVIFAFRSDLFVLNLWGGEEPGLSTVARQARDTIVEEAKRCGMPFVDQRWLGGMLTNFKTIRQSIRRLAEIDELQASGALDQRNKREAQMVRREREKLDRSLGGIKDMDGLPDVMFVVDVGHENIAIHEAQKLGIPVVAVVDTNCDPDLIDYKIPGNDDALRSVRLLVETLAKAEKSHAGRFTKGLEGIS